MQSYPNAYHRFDRPEILSLLFHPRPDEHYFTRPENTRELQIPVASGDKIGAKFHPGELDGPVVLFFHGNGEIVSDYDDLAPKYTAMGINFMPVDYRGYGTSTGMPTISAMMEDGHEIFAFVQRYRQEHHLKGPLVVMGRSLGSASALELGRHYTDEVAALIIDSGFAFALPLLKLLGIDVDGLNLSEEDGFQNIAKIKKIAKPTVIIHGEFDHIIPFSDGKALYEASPAAYKKLVTIHHADHNSIFYHGMETYMNAIFNLKEHLKTSGAPQA